MLYLPFNWSIIVESHYLFLLLQDLLPQILLEVAFWDPLVITINSISSWFRDPQRSPSQSNLKRNRQKYISVQKSNRSLGQYLSLRNVNLALSNDLQPLKSATLRTFFSTGRMSSNQIKYRFYTYKKTTPDSINTSTWNKVSK